jgi:four helix bundle protein
MDLAGVCFDIVESIPHPYRFTFTDQVIRAGVSIPSNVAEGSRRPTRAHQMLQGLVQSLDGRLNNEHV